MGPEHRSAATTIAKPAAERRLQVGFSPRKQNLSLYIMSGFDGYEDLLEGLGKHSTGKACLYVKRLDDVDTDVLARLVARSIENIESAYPDES